MPLYRTKQDELVDEIARLEIAGETVTQIMTDPETLDGFIILTSKPVNTTGRAWLPNTLGQTETR